MKTIRFAALGVLAAGTLAAGAAQAVTLGAFTFDDTEFGDSLTQSDGGTFAASNWLNTTNVDPGSPGYLTGADFETGIANIGLGGSTVDYTIGYGGDGIDNSSGDDLGIVTARFSTNDTISIAFSLDGITFSGPFSIGPGAATATGVNKSYFYNGSGPFGAQLFVTSIDLSSYGFGAGDQIKAIRVTGAPELDLIRVAGFGVAGVPEPASWALMIAGFGVSGAMLRRRRSVLAA